MKLIRAIRIAYGANRLNRKFREAETDLWERVTSYDALQAAWWKVNANEGSAGGDGVNRHEFGHDVFANLTQLRAELLAGSYRTGPFRKVSIPKKKPGYRILTIPSIRDRVVHTSIASVLNPIFEATFEDGSFGYRPNRGVTDAVRRIETWRDRGYDVVIEADIIRYFDNIDHEILAEKIDPILEPLPGSAPLLSVIRRLLNEQAMALQTPGQGLAQGSPLSPLLANLYLDALDEEIEAHGVKVVRFADDFVILCKSERKAEKVLTHCTQVLGQHNLKLHDDGTRIVSFEKGFDFVGYLFLKTLALKQARDPHQLAPAQMIKSTVTDEGIIELGDNGSLFDPGKRVLYILDDQHSLGIRNRSFSVRREDGSELIAIPHKRVGRIEIGPGVTYGQKVIELALDVGVGLSIADGFGQTKGTLVSAKPKWAGRQLAQARAVLHDEFRVEVSRRIVDSRIRNQRTQLMRLNRTRNLKDVRDALQVMMRTLRKVDHAAGVGELLGLEGSSSADYWPALGRLFDHSNGTRLKRSRPAADPINAAINYLTGILERDTRAAIQGAGLHPGFAFLHASRDRHDGLVYDLMEPFRAALTEGVVVFLFNAGRLTPEMFTETTGASIQISDEGRRAIVLGYESAVARRVNKPDGSGKLAWRPMMLHQARGLIRSVRANDPELFTPYLMEA